MPSVASSFCFAYDHPGSPLCAVPRGAPRGPRKGLPEPLVDGPWFVVVGFPCCKGFPRPRPRPRPRSVEWEPAENCCALRPVCMSTAALSLPGKDGVVVDFVQHVECFICRGQIESWRPCVSRGSLIASVRNRTGEGGSRNCKGAMRRFRLNALQFLTAVVVMVGIGREQCTMQPDCTRFTYDALVGHSI